MSPRVFVPGVPAPQGSKRFLGRSSRGRVKMAESSARVAPWRAAIADKVEQAMGGVEPSPHAIALSVRFIFPRPKGHYGSGRNAGVVKPNAPRLPSGQRDDLDKLLRAVLDAMTSIAFADDGQVVVINAGKEYGNAAGADLRWDVIA